MLQKIERFELKEEHVKLLSNTNIYWSESYYGAPAVYPKKPYGNSNIHKDIARILGEEYDEQSSEQHTKFNILHEETEIALQVVLDSKSFEPGVYEKQDYGKWYKI